MDAWEEDTMAEASDAAAGEPLADRLNELGVLTRREVEARILAPLLAALGEEFGHERVLTVARRTIIEIARRQGAALAEQMGGRSLVQLADSMVNWTKGGALELTVLARDEERLAFNVTRCRYAEMYRALGVPELGALLSCNRDYALVEGFSDQIELRRTQTIMEGAAYCDFRYRRRPTPTGSDGGAEPAE
jgi:predicted ArsR family transcriptional regulator